MECLESGWISSRGHFVGEFESKFAEFCGTKFAISTANGTVALHLALLALGIKKDDEVIVPTFSYVATANAVCYTGAKPVFVDSEYKTWNMDPDEIERNISKKTRAIIVVHLYGHPCDMDKILKVAKRFDLKVIEDAAEAHGALYKGKKVGGIGDVGCFSFFGNKMITTGEGGMVVTNDADVAEKARFLHDQATIRRYGYYHSEIGYNYRMTNIQAAIGLAQLERFDSFRKRKRQVVEWYRKGLADLEVITLPPEEKWAENVYWMFSILTNKKNAEESRDGLVRSLQQAGIETRPFFLPIHTLPPYQDSREQHFRIAEDLSKRGINLPSSVKLTKDQVEYITYHIRKVLMAKNKSSQTTISIAEEERRKYWENYFDYWKDRVKKESKNILSRTDVKTPDVSLFGKYYKKAKRHVTTPKAKVLEIGVGFGRLLPTFSKDFAQNIWGIDISQKMINECRKLFPKIKANLQVSPAEEINMESSQFSFIVCWGVFDATYQNQTLMEISRLLDIGGVALISGKNINYFVSDEKSIEAEIGARRKGHPNYFTDTGLLKKYISRFGLAISEFYRFKERGDISADKVLKNGSSKFYEYIIILKKVKDAKKGVYVPKIYRQFSNTYLHLRKLRKV